MAHMADKKTISLRMDRQTVAYLVGQNRQNLSRLEKASGARITAGNDIVDLKGTPDQLDLIRLCIDCVLSQRRESNVRLPFAASRGRVGLGLRDCRAATARLVGGVTLSVDGVPVLCVSERSLTD